MKVLRIILGLSLTILMGCFKVVDKESKAEKEVEVESQNYLEEELFWEGEVFLTENTEISAKRLVLENAKVYTQGFDLSIESSEILAEDSMIANFKEGQQADYGIDGRSGSSIWIKAEKARGDLYVLMNGEHGGEGRPGKNNLDTGARGKAGQYGYHGVEIGKTSGRGMYPSDKMICVKQPQDGGPGGKGPGGAAGGSGANGGDSGALVLDFFDGGELRLLVERTFGKAGRGGLGGAGGPGGRGGDPGILYNNRKKKKRIKKANLDLVCRKAKPGPNGSQGDRGKAGEDGTPGEEQKICLRLKAHENFNCY